MFRVYAGVYLSLFHKMAYRKKDPVRMLLIGRTGDGKSSTGNTILGREEFETSRLSTSQTKTSELKRSEWEGRSVEVVDTPGIFDTENGHSHLPVLKELIRALLITTPGFHVIAFVLKPGKFTQEVESTLKTFFHWFGQGVEKHACVILTHTNSAATMKDYLENKPHPVLTNLVTKCCGRVVCLDNGGTPELKKSQLQELFQMVDQINTANDGQCFTNSVYKLAEIYADSRDGTDISKNSILLLRNAGLPWSAEYCGAAENAFSSTISDIEEDNTSETTSGIVDSNISASTSIKGNLTIIDENDVRLPNTVPQCLSPDHSTRDDAFDHTDQVGGRSGRIDFSPARNEYTGVMAHPIAATYQDNPGSSLSSEARYRSLDTSYIDIVSSTDVDNSEGDRYLQTGGKNVDTESEQENAGANKTGRSDRKIDMASVRADDPVDRHVGRSGRKVNMDSIQVDVPVDNDRRSSISQDRNKAIRTDNDQYMNFRQNANDNVTRTARFMGFVTKVRNKICTIL